MTILQKFFYLSPFYTPAFVCDLQRISSKRKTRNDFSIFFSILIHFFFLAKIEKITGKNRHVRRDGQRVAGASSLVQGSECSYIVQTLKDYQSKRHGDGREVTPKEAIDALKRKHEDWIPKCDEEEKTCEDIWTVLYTYYKAYKKDADPQKYKRKFKHDFPEDHHQFFEISEPASCDGLLSTFQRLQWAKDKGDMAAADKYF